MRVHLNVCMSVDMCILCVWCACACVYVPANTRVCVHVCIHRYI